MGRPPAALLGALGAALLAYLVPAAPALAGSPAPTTTGPVVAAAGSSKGAPTMTLLSQTPWVGPGEPMQLRLGLGGQDRSGLSLAVTLYQHLSSRSAFAETVGGTAVGGVLSSATVPVDSLPADPQGGVDLTVPVSSGDAAATGAGPMTAQLRCPAGGCGGVYPMRLQLSVTGTTTRTQLFTYLVYANPPVGTQKLRFALVVPFAAPVPLPDRGGAQPPLSSASVGKLETIATALGTHDAPVTVVPEAATVAALSAAGRPRGRSLLAALGALSTAPDHELLASSYVPVDATALASAGLQGELGEQVRRADQVLAGLHPSTGIWLTNSAVDQESLAALASLGFGRLVLPASAVQTPASPLTPSRPFTLIAGRSPTATATAVESDAALSSHLAAGSGAGAALAGYQLLADLALVYYEQPNLAEPRGVVAVPPAGWAPTAPFLDSVLSALPSDPLVSPVTLDQLFGTVAASAGAARRAVVPSGSSSLPARQIRTARSHLAAFASAVNDAGLPTVHALDDLLLGAEGSSLRAGQQQQLLAAHSAALQAQLAQLSVRTDTIRLTSTAAKVPVTLVKQSSYSVTGTLQILGDKVAFPAASQQDPGAVCRQPEVQASAGRSRFECTATIGHATNAVYVAMRARATGDFRLSVTLTSPRGNLVLASSHLTVRSMSTSLVAIGLSLAAVAVLLLWWGRTLWRGRRPSRHGAHVRGAATRDA